GAVADIFERLGDVLVDVVEAEAAMRQAEHPGRVRALAGEEGGAAGRAGGRSGEGAAEEHTLFGKPLDAGRGHGVAVGLDVLARVVRMKKDDVRPGHESLRLKDRRINLAIAPGGGKCGRV